MALRPSTDVVKRISCPVHGSICLTEIEKCIIDTCAFQRLRNVQHLGLASYVFPSANYTRFAHSIGVCHTVSSLIDSLESHPRNDRHSKEDKFLYKLAGLLHDIGHLPFSHVFEQALEDVIESENNLVKRKEDGNIETENSSDTKSAIEEFEFIDHEKVSQLIIKNNYQLREIFDQYGINPSNVSSIIEKDGSFKDAKLIASDLDADRLDYLQRTAHHSGIPYGSIDYMYLSSQIRKDKEGRICFSKKALRTIEHVLLSRYFEYQQIVYHKTIRGFEKMLRDVLKEWIEKNTGSLTRDGITELIINGDWNSFDDVMMLNEIRKISRSNSTNSPKSPWIAQNLINRIPPHLVYEFDYICNDNPSQSGNDEFDDKLENVRNIVGEELDSCGNDFHIYLDEPKPIRISKHQYDESAFGGQAHEDIVRIMDDDPSKSSIPIYEVPHSIIGKFLFQSIKLFRVYCLPKEKNQASIEYCKELQLKIEKDIS